MQDAVDHRHYQLSVCSAPLLPQEPACIGRKQGQAETLYILSTTWSFQCQSIKQPINHSVNQASKQLIIKLINQSIKNNSIINHSINNCCKWVKQWTKQTLIWMWNINVEKVKLLEIDVSILINQKSITTNLYGSRHWWWMKKRRWNTSHTTRTRPIISNRITDKETRKLLWGCGHLANG